MGKSSFFFVQVRGGSLIHEAFLAVKGHKKAHWCVALPRPGAGFVYGRVEFRLMACVGTQGGWAPKTAKAPRGGREKKGGKLALAKSNWRGG